MPIAIGVSELSGIYSAHRITVLEHNKCNININARYRSVHNINAISINTTELGSPRISSFSIVQTTIGIMPVPIKAPGLGACWNIFCTQNYCH